MCGLAGILSLTPISNGTGIIQGMIDPINHRGPDQDGIFLDPSGKAALGHKRLSIIDLSAGRQPMTDADGLLTLVFNGEIYNHHEIKAELIRRGHPIKSRSDTETLLYAYKEFGPACLDRLRGMFAFAVHDKRDGSMFVARDRMGIKPVYYSHRNGLFLFGSECKAILAFPGFDRSIDVQALSDYLSLMYVPAPKSIYKHVRKLPAGHWMKVAADGKAEIRKYWDVAFMDASEYGSSKSMEQAQEEILAVLDEAVSSHMESDVPLGAFLSGGVDSSAVVALMAKHSSQPILTNTIGFSNKAYDETAQARSTSDHFKTRHHEFTVKPDAVRLLEKLAYHYDEPFADSSMIPTYYVCEMARRNVTVALSGDGGDESFAGYRRYFHDRFENSMRSALPGMLRAPLFGALGAVYPKADWLPQPLRAKTLLRNLSYDPMRGYFTSMSHILPGLKARLMTGDMAEQLKGYDSLSVFEEHWNNSGSEDPLSRIQYLDMKTYLVEDVLAKVDRASMAVSLEVRVPVLDHKVVELAARMPSSWKLRGRASKYIFKEALKKALPGEIFTRPKAGFSIPLREWMRNELKEYSRERLLGANGLASWGLFRKDTLEMLLKEHHSGMMDHSHALFALLSLSLWKERFLDPTPGPSPRGMA